MNHEKDGTEEFFFDSYALYAVIKGENAYKKFTTRVRVITTMMNIYEVYYQLLKENLYREADIFFTRFEGSCIPIYPKAIKEAARFKLANHKNNVSYVDALGYVMAQQQNMTFLTGDKSFQNLPNVRFVK